MSKVISVRIYVINKKINASLISSFIEYIICSVIYDTKWS